MERVALVRPFTWEVIHPDIYAFTKSGSDAGTLSNPGDISFTVEPGWHNRLAGDDRPFFIKRGTLVVVERANRTIRQVGLVDDLTLTETGLDVSCGGFSMILGQSGPWEGAQRAHVGTDPVVLFRDVVAQVQSYSDANLGIRVVGDTVSGSTVGDPGSRRWQNAKREFDRLKPELEKWESRVLARERIVSQRKEAMFRAAGLKRVGTVRTTEDGNNPPEDPEYQADSTLWVREDIHRAHRWRDGRWWSLPATDAAVKHWMDYQPALQRAKYEVNRLQYLVEPLQERLDELEDEAKEEYSLYFWQNHDLNTVIEDLLAIGPFEYREEAAWTTDSNGDDRLDLMLRVGAPKVGVRRHELHLELGVNVHEQPVMEYGETYTGVALFGAGEGSEVLSAQQDLGLDGIVRRILVETDKDAHTKQLTRAAANKLADQAKKDMGLGFTDLVIHHSPRLVPEGSFNVGDELKITGELSDGSKTTQWVRVLEATHEWGSSKTTVEVEPVS
jgi:hypothetical protein